MRDEARAIAKAVAIPSSDTPTPHAGFDPRAEPIMLTAPVIEPVFLGAIYGGKGSGSRRTHEDGPHQRRLVQRSAQESAHGIQGAVLRHVLAEALRTRLAMTGIDAPALQ